MGVKEIGLHEKNPTTNLRHSDHFPDRARIVFDVVKKGKSQDIIESLVWKRQDPSVGADIFPDGTRM